MCSFGKSAQELGFAPRDLSASASEEGIAEGVSESIEIAPEEHTSADTLALAVQLSTEKLPKLSLQLPSPVESVGQKGSFVRAAVIEASKSTPPVGSRRTWSGGSSETRIFCLTLQNTHSKQSSHLKVTTPLRVPLSQRLHHLFDVTISNWVNHLAWSPDNRYLAVASGTNNLVIWNIEKDVIALIYLTLNKWVNDVSWSKTNRVAAVTAEAGAGSLHLWKIPCPGSSDYHEERVCVAFSYAGPLMGPIWQFLGIVQLSKYGTHSPSYDQSLYRCYLEPFRHLAS